VHIVKINPLIPGVKEQVVKSMQRMEKNILDAWYFKDELGENDTVIEAGQRSIKNFLSSQLPSC